MQIVYGVSARENSGSFSLNDCLETGPALQNLLWSVLIRTRFIPIALCGDLQKASLQIRIKADNRDALRFHWFKERDPNQIETLQFSNCRNKEKLSGPLDRAETEKAKLFWIKHEQRKTEKTDNFKEDQGCLNLQKNNAGICQCMGRFQGQHSLYIPRRSILAEKIVDEAHKRTMHGEMISIMAGVRENYWITKLQQLMKKVIRNCLGCKRFQVKPFATSLKASYQLIELWDQDHFKSLV